MRTRIELAGMLLGGRGARKLAIAGLAGRFLPRRLKRLALGVAAAGLVAAALVAVLVALLVSGSL